MGTLTDVIRRTGRLNAVPREEGAGFGQVSEREQAIIDRYKSSFGSGQLSQTIATGRAQKEIDARRQQRAYSEQAPPEMAEPVREMLSNLGNRAKVLDTYRKLSPEQRQEALRLAPGISQQLGDDRGGAVGRTLGAVSRGISHGVSQPIAELVGLGGTPEEIEFIRQLDAAASQEFSPARPGDPWYERGPLQAAEMAPWMATVVTGAGLGRAAATGIAGRVAGRAAAGGKIAGAITKATPAIGKAGELAGITAAAFPSQYAQEVDQLKALGMEDNLTMRLLAGGTAAITGLVEGIVPNPFGAGKVPLTEGAVKAARQYLWEAAKKAPGEMSEEYLQGVTSGLGAHVAQYLDENAEEKTIADAFQNGWEQAKEAALPMAFLLGVPGLGGAGLSAVRAQRLSRLQEIRAKGFVSAEEAKELGIQGKNRGERKANADAEIEQLSVLPVTPPLTQGATDAIQVPTNEEVQGQGEQNARIEREQEAGVQGVEQQTAQGDAGTEVQVAPPEVRAPWELTRAEHVAERERLIGEFRRLSDKHGGGPAAMQVPEVAAAFRAQEEWSDLDIGHKPSVQKAIKEGKPVPPAVLAEYPALSKSPVPPVDTERDQAEDELAGLLGSSPTVSPDAPVTETSMGKAEGENQSSEARADTPEPTGWRVAFDSETDTYKKAQLLRALANKPSTPQELSDILDRVTGLEDETNIRWTVGLNPAATEDIISRAESEGSGVLTADGKIPRAGEYGKKPLPPTKLGKKGATKPARRMEPTEEGRPADGKPVKPGDRFLTNTGRETTPYPKYSGSTNRQVINAEKKSQLWLMENAIAEAESRGDEFNARTFRSELEDARKGKLPQASKDSATLYVFGEDVPKVPKPFLKEPGKTSQNSDNVTARPDKSSELDSKPGTQPEGVGSSAPEIRGADLPASEQARANLRKRGKKKPSQAELDAEAAAVIREREADNKVRQEFKADRDAQKAQDARREFVSAQKTLANPATVDSLGVGDISQVNDDIERGRVSYDDATKVADEFVAAGYLPQGKRDQIRKPEPTGEQDTGTKRGQTGEQLGNKPEVSTIVDKTADTAPVPQQPEGGGPATTEGQVPPTQAESLPWINSTAEQESSWYGTKVNVAPANRREDAYTGQVVRVLNNGEMVEVQPDGQDGTFRVDSARITLAEEQSPTTEKQAEEPAAEPLPEPTIPKFTRTTPDKGSTTRQFQSERVEKARGEIADLERKRRAKRGEHDGLRSNATKKRAAVRGEIESFNRMIGKVEGEIASDMAADTLAKLEDELESPRSYDHYLAGMKAIHKLKASVVEDAARRGEMGREAARTEVSREQKEADRLDAELQSRAKEIAMSKGFTSGDAEQIALSASNGFTVFEDRSLADIVDVQGKRTRESRVSQEINKLKPDSPYGRQQDLSNEQIAEFTKQYQEASLDDKNWLEKRKEVDKAVREAIQASREAVRKREDEERKVKEAVIQVGDETISDISGLALEELNRRMDEAEQPSDYPKQQAVEQDDDELASLRAQSDKMYNEIERLQNAGKDREANALIREAEKLTPRIKELEAPIIRAKQDAEVAAKEERRKEHNEKEDARKAALPTKQTRNGWELATDGARWYLRDPNTKEIIYEGKLTRVREVADESPPDSPSTAEQGSDKPSASELTYGSSPIGKLFAEAKAAGGADTMLMFRMGDFYELFFEDAQKAAKMLGLTLTTRDKSADNPIPMTGFPYHQLDGYLKKLKSAGIRVAVNEEPFAKPQAKAKAEQKTEPESASVPTQAEFMEMSNGVNAPGVKQTIRVTAGERTLLMERSKHDGEWSIREAEKYTGEVKGKTAVKKGGELIVSGIVETKKAKEIAQRIIDGNFDKDADKRFVREDTQNIGLTNAGIAKSIKDSLQRRGSFAKLLRENGLVTDGRFLMKVSDKDRVAILKAVGETDEGRDLGVVAKMMDDGQKALSRAANAMNPIGYRGGYLTSRTVVLQSKDGDAAVLDKALHDTILKKYPNAVPYFLEEEKPVSYASDGELIAIVMPMNASKPDALVNELVSGKYDFEAAAVEAAKFPPPQSKTKLQKAAEIEGQMLASKGNLASEETTDDEQDGEASDGEGGGIAQMQAIPTRQSRSKRFKGDAASAAIAAADIQKTAERLFDVPIRQGGFNQRAAGIYKWITRRTGPPSPEVVRTAEDHYANLAVVAHEIAHHIDETVKAVRSMPKAVKQEIKRLDYEPEKERAFEGWAEFLRRYMTEPPIDVAGTMVPNPGLDAPKTLAWFESTFLQAHPEVAKSIAEFRKYAQQFAQQSVFQRVGTLIADRQPQDLSFKERWLSKARRRVHRLKTNFIDKFHTLEWIQKEAENRGHEGIGIYDLTMAHYMSATSHATIAFEEGVRTLQTGAPIGSTTLWGLRDNLEADGEYNDAVLYSLARHTLFMNDTKPGYNTGMDVKDAEAWITEVEASGKRDRFEKFAKQLAQFNDDLIEMLVEAGALPKKDADTMLRSYDNQNYFPLHRVQDTDRSMFAGSGAGFVNLGRAVPGRSRKGSGRQIVDPVDATVTRAIRFYGRAIQARQQQVLAEALDPLMGGVGGMGGLMDRVDPRRTVTQGTIEEILKTLTEEGVIEADDANAMRIAAKILNPEGGTPGAEAIEWFAERHGIEEVDGEYDMDALEQAASDEPDALAVISLWRPDYTPSAQKRTVVIYDKQGKPIMYEMDPDLYATATGMDELQFGPFMSVFREAARWFKTGAVSASTGFGTANLLRDYWEFQGKARHTKGLASLGKPPAMLGRYIAEKSRKLAGFKANDPLIRLYEESGGKVYSVIGHDVRSRKQYRRRRIGKSTMSKLGLSMARPGDTAESLLDGIQDLIAISDAPPRLADAEAAIKEDGFVVRDGKWFDTNASEFVDHLPEATRIKAATAMAEATINFKRIGAKGQYIEAFMPFFNATVQSMYRQYGQIKGLKRIGRKDVDGLRAQRYLVYMSALASMGVLYWMLRRDDDDWREQDAYLRDGYWTWGANGKTYVRIPKPRDTAIVSNIVENMLDAWYRDDAREMKDVVLRDFGGRLPTGGGLVRGALETYIADYDYFRERDLTPEYMKELPKEQQFTSHTTRASKAIGQVTGRYLQTSPIQLEHLLSSASGGFYRRMADLYDASLDGRLGPEHLPFLRGLVLDRHQARSVNDFYDTWEQSELSAKREEASNGKVSDATTGKLAVLAGHAELMTAIRNLEQTVGTRRDYAYQPYIVGLARHSLGYEELPSNPNPLTAEDVPPPIADLMKDYTGRVVMQASETLKALKEYEDEEAYQTQYNTVLRGKVKLTSLGLTLEQAKKSLLDYWAVRYGSVRETKGGRPVLKESVRKRLNELTKLYTTE